MERVEVTLETFLRIAVKSESKRGRDWFSVKGVNESCNCVSGKN